MHEGGSQYRGSAERWPRFFPEAFMEAVEQSIVREDRLMMALFQQTLGRGVLLVASYFLRRRSDDEVNFSRDVRPSRSKTACRATEDAPEKRRLVPISRTGPDIVPGMVSVGFPAGAEGL